MVNALSVETASFDGIVEAYSPRLAEESVAVGGLSVLARAKHEADTLVAQAEAGEQDLNGGMTAFQSATEEPRPIEF